MSPARVVAVAPESPAARAGVRTGDEILTVNGEAIRDVIRYQVQVEEPRVDLLLRRGDTEHPTRIDKRAGEPLGVELHSAVFDRIRTCDNHCPFCFIYQLPKGMRTSLSLKDDDYRLSHLYGNFTTLTRFTEADLERVVTEGLGPLYVSIHATDPDVRTELLRNRRGATSLRWLRVLLDEGVEIHGQIVVCPGVNDGEVLDDTLLGILDRYPEIASVGAVPLGVSAHNAEPTMRPHTAAEAVDALRTIETWQERFLDSLGRRMVFAADEYYLMTGEPWPAAAAYEGFPQHENGIGMAREFVDGVRAAARGVPTCGVGPRPGFFAWVDGAPAAGYRAPRTLEVVDSRAPAPHPAGPTTILTGEYGATVLGTVRDDLATVAGDDVEIRPVANRFFGGNIAVTGLLTGADVAAAVSATGTGRRVLLPDVVLSQDRFLDDATVAELPRPVEVVPTTAPGLVIALRSAA
jgi:putative radical SAM enzyme (TIGR03279 family)